MSGNHLHQMSAISAKSRLSSELLQLSKEFTSITRVPEGLRQDYSSLQFDPSGTRVSVRITTSDAENLLPALKDLGFEVSGSAPELNFVEGFLPITALNAAESLTARGLLGILPLYQPVTRVGSVTSQADFVLEADRVRAALPTGFDGSGVQIGVLSDSYDNLGGASADIASGDLPAAGVNVLQDLQAGGSDEGRAMLQLIHDLAPGASLSFATAFSTPTVFANNIRALADAGADIIVDDIGYLAEPFFQDGVVSQAVDEVVTNSSVAYFSAAGNSGNIAYESTGFDTASDSIGPLVDATFYDFDPSAEVDTRQRITIPNGAQVQFSLQWDDPFFTNGGVDTDVDVFLVNSTTNEIVAASFLDNIAAQAPQEFFTFTNNTGQTDFDIMLQLFDGPAPGRIKYIPFGLGGFEADPSAIYQEFATNSSTIFAHPAAANASAVAAVPFFDQTNPEPFTSLGPTTILFEPDGTPKAEPEVRQTPRIASIDGAETTFFGQDVDGNGIPNFFGTSAAAPHAAAVAALVKQANPDFTPAQIYERLESTATDLGTLGFDNLTGFGLINAYDAVFGAVTPASVAFSNDFEDGDLPIAYETRSTGAGRIQVTTDGEPVGTHHLRLDSSLKGFGLPSLNEAILHVDTTSFTDLSLSFDQKEFDDADDPMPETFTDSVDADGVALSVDGTNWFRLVDLTGNNSTNTYQTQTINLSEFAANNGLTLNAGVQIKFQQFNDTPSPTDGFAFDNISLTGTSTSPDGGPGDDFLKGTSDDDTINGNGGDDLILGAPGNDLLNGGTGDDRLFGDEGNDTLFGASGADFLKGSLGDDLLSGGEEDDTLLGDSGKDTLLGDGGDDFLDGGADADLMFGGSGSDIFVLAAEEGADTILDFADGQDLLGLARGLTFADLAIAAVGSNTLISIAASDELLVTLIGVESSAIAQTDFAQL